MSVSEAHLRAIKRWQANNREKVNQINNQWRKDNPEKVIESRTKSVHNVLYLSAKHRAKRTGIDFNIDKESIIIPDICPYLKAPITRIYGKGRIATNPSLDRIDSNQGYIKGNVQVISDLANRMKANATKEELIQFSKSVLEMEGYTILDRTDNS